jgi:MoxR-like ATPase
MAEETAHGYGARVDAERLVRLLDHVFSRNLDQVQQGARGTPVCIWGRHGVGKTEIVQQLAARNGWELAYCAPAQFEEMGDLHGLPVLDPSGASGPRTTFAPPDWVPTREGPGILLLDDLNRADDRMLRGLMQLLQRFEMFSWALPPKWQIVATANPEGSEYSVTTMDDAMLTRFLHVSLVFDVKAWVSWALDNGVDRRGIDFVLTYPEVLDGRRTSPRTLTQFFGQIAHIADLRAELELVRLLAESALDDVTVATFITFVNDDLTRLIDPDEILESDDWKSVDGRITELADDGDTRRVDRLQTIGTRLVLTVTRPGYEPAERHGENLVRFLSHDVLPADLRVALHRDLATRGAEPLKALMRDKRLAKLLLAGM